MNKRERNNWLFATLLTLPVAVFMIGYLASHSAGLIPTGFIQYDNVAYIAYAKQYIDASHFHLLYANPFEAEAPRIYFQPQILLFALLMKIGVPSGWILIPFTLICSIICFRIVIAIYDHLMPFPRYRKWNICLFSWGGGLLVLASLAAHYYLQRPVPVLSDLFIVDPEGGWWGLNLGRSLLFSIEAYYHALFLGCVLCMMKKKFGMGVLILFILSLSHPFTGIELAAIIGVWCAIEFIINRKEMPAWVLTASFAVIIFHLYYYLIYLEQFPEHSSVSDQYSLNWRLRFYRMIPAYFLTGALALATFIKIPFRNFFAFRTSRLFTCWFVVAFLLANHEIFMSPKQPVHFTRGYIWTSLFLLGLPVLHQLNEFMKRKWRHAGFMLIGLLFFMDNFLWITVNATTTARQPDPTYINSEQKDVLKIVEKESSNKTIVVSEDKTIGYLSSVYTTATPWFSHPYTTPFAPSKKKAMELFFTNGIMDSSWKGKEIVFVVRRNNISALKALSSATEAKSIESGDYTIVLFRPLK